MIYLRLINTNLIFQFCPVLKRVFSMWLKSLSSPLGSGFKHFYWEKKVMLKTIDLLFAITFISFICPETQIQMVVIMHTWKY